MNKDEHKHKTKHAIHYIRYVCMYDVCVRARPKNYSILFSMLAIHNLLYYMYGVLYFLTYLIHTLALYIYIHVRACIYIYIYIYTVDITYI